MNQSRFSNIKDKKAVIDIVIEHKVLPNKYKSTTCTRSVHSTNTIRLSLKTDKVDKIKYFPASLMKNYIILYLMKLVVATTKLSSYWQLNLD